MLYGFDEFELDAERLELRRAGRVVRANSLAVRLLLALVRNAGRLVTKDELVAQVWEDRAVADNVITVSVARLRQTLGQRRGAREFVTTVYGRGYRFTREVTVRSASARAPAAPQFVTTAALAGPQFVGRERVLVRLSQALHDARAGHGRLCALLGEPGIGKTRAIEAFEPEVASAGAQLAWGYCRQAGDTPPLWPWLRLLREVMAGQSTSELEQRLGPLAAELHALLGEPVRSDDAPRHRAFEAVLRTLTLAAERTPLVLVLDDLHRADAASIELLGWLLDELAHAPILVLATARHAPRPETQLPYVLGHRNCEAIVLERLSAGEVAEYVAALAGDASGELGRAVFDKSEGNPFFMVELSRPLRDADAVQPERALSLPDTALDLIRQRLAVLDRDARDVLAVAAVIGRSFELGLLAAITGREPSELMAGLDEALAAEVVVAAKDSRTAFAFGHELLRDVLYDALAPAEQRRFHLRVGDALEQRVAAGEDIPPAEIAYHLHAALPEGNLRKTVEYCRRAADAAAAVFANPDVVRNTRRALEALELMPEPSVRLRGRLLYMTALYARGDGVEFPRAIGKVLRLAQEQADGALLVSAAAMLNPHPGFQPLPGGSAALTHALDLLQPEHAALRAIALAGLACAAPQCWVAERCDALVAEALALARASGSRTALRVALEAALHLQGGPRHAARAAEVVEELQRLGDAGHESMPVLPVGLAIHEAISALQRGEGAAVARALGLALARCRELRHGELLWHCERFALLSRINAGTLGGVAAELNALHQRAEQRPILGTEPFCAFDRAVVFAELGLSSSLDAAGRRALALDGAEPPSIASLKLRALATAGLETEARAALHVFAPADLAQLPHDAHYLGTLGHVARAALPLRALDHAEALYELLAPYPDHFAGHVAFLCEGSVAQLLGMLAHALGRRAAAIEHLEAGVQLNERAGLAPRAAEARSQLTAARKRQP